MSDLALTIQHETPADADSIEKLHERAFGPGRFARSSERVREQATQDLSLSFIARVATLLVGSVRLTPIHMGNAKALMLGPLAVEPAFRSRGIGRALIERAIADATRAGYELIVLVGDEPYYGRLGFKRAAMNSILMPGPVDPMRILLWAASEEARATARGAVRGG